jgi:hypothetical protein
LLPEEHLIVALAPGETPTARVVRLAGTPSWALRLSELGHG